MEFKGAESLREELLLHIDEDDVDDAKVVGNGDLHPKIRVRDLRKQTEEGMSLLSGVSVDIWKGTVVGVIGPSGSGKSTFLRALNRLWEPPADSVFLDYNDITKLDVLSLRRWVGTLFQTPALFEGSVADNIRYGPALRGKKLSDEEVGKYLGFADLDSSLAARSVGGLSVGQAQRVALARALANEPEVGLAFSKFGAAAGRADERPGSNLDSAYRGVHREAEEGQGDDDYHGLPQRQTDSENCRCRLSVGRWTDCGDSETRSALQCQPSHGSHVP